MTFWAADQVATGKKKNQAATTGRFVRYERKVDNADFRSAYELAAEINMHDVEWTLPQRLYGHVKEARVKLASPLISIGSWFDDYRMDNHVIIRQFQFRGPSSTTPSSLTVTDLGAHISDMSDFDFETKDWVSYAGLTNVRVGGIASSIAIVDLIAISEWASCFGYHLANIDNHVPEQAEFMKLNPPAGEDAEQRTAEKEEGPRKNAPYLAQNITLDQIDLQVRSEHGDSVLQVLSYAPIKITSDTQIRQSSSSMTRVTTGLLEMHQLLDLSSKYVPPELGAGIEPLGPSRLRKVATIKTMVTYMACTRQAQWWLLAAEQAKFIADLDHPHKYVTFVDHNALVSKESLKKRKFLWSSATSTTDENGQSSSILNQGFNRSGGEDLPWMTPFHTPKLTLAELNDWNGELFESTDPLLRLLRNGLNDPARLHLRLPPQEQSQGALAGTLKGSLASALKSPGALEVPADGFTDDTDPAVEYECLGQPGITQRIEQTPSFIRCLNGPVDHCESADSDLSLASVSPIQNRSALIDYEFPAIVEEIEPGVENESDDTTDSSVDPFDSSINVNGIRAMLAQTGGDTGAVSDTDATTATDGSADSSNSGIAVEPISPRRPLQRSNGKRKFKQAANKVAIVNRVASAALVTHTSDSSEDSFVSAPSGMPTSEEEESASFQSLENDEGLPQSIDSSSSSGDSHRLGDDKLGEDDIVPPPPVTPLLPAVDVSTATAAAVVPTPNTVTLTHENMKLFNESTVETVEEFAVNRIAVSAPRNSAAIKSASGQLAGASAQLAAARTAARQFKKLAQRVVNVNRMIAKPVQHSRRFQEKLQNNAPKIWSKTKRRVRVMSSKSLEETPRYYATLDAVTYTKAHKAHTQPVVKNLPPAYAWPPVFSVEEPKDPDGDSDDVPSPNLQDQSRDNEAGRDQDVNLAEVGFGEAVDIMVTPLAIVGANILVAELNGHVAEQDIRKCWMRELDALQIAFMGPEQIETSEATISVSKMRIKASRINFSLLQDGWFGRTVPLHTALPTLSELHGLRGASILAMQLRDASIYLGSKTLIDCVNGRMVTSMVDSLTSATVNAFQIELHTPSSMADTQIEGTTALLIEDNELFDACLAQIMVDNVEMRYKTRDMSTEADENRHAVLVGVGGVEIECHPASAIAMTAMTTAWSIAMDGLSESLAVKSTTCETTRRKMFSALMRTCAIKRSQAVFPTVLQSAGNYQFRPWHNEISIQCSEYIKAQQFAPQLARSVKKTLVDDYNRMLLFEFATTIGTASRLEKQHTFGNHGEHQGELASPPWFPAEEVAPQLSVLIEGFISNTDILNPYGLSRFTGAVLFKVDEISCMMQEAPEIRHFFNLQKIELTAKAEYIPFTSLFETDSFGGGDFHQRHNAEIKATAHIGLSNVIAVFNPSMIALNAKISTELAPAAKLMKEFEARKMAAKHGFGGVGDGDGAGDGTPGGPIVTMSSPGVSIASFDGEPAIAGTGRPSQSTSLGPDYLNPVDQRSHNRTGSGPPKKDKAWKKKSKFDKSRKGQRGGGALGPELQPQYNLAQHHPSPAKSSAGTPPMNSNGKLSITVYAVLACDEFQLGTGAESAAIEVISSAFSAGLEYAADVTSTLDKSSALEKITSTHDVDVISANVGISQIKLDLNKTKIKDSKKRAKGVKSKFKPMNEAVALPIVTLILKGARVLVSVYRQTKDSFIGVDSIEFLSVRKVAESEAFLGEMFKIYQGLSTPTEVSKTPAEAAAAASAASDDLDAAQHAPIMSTTSVRLLVKRIVMKTSVLAAVKLMYEAGSLEALAIFRGTGSDVRVGLRDHSLAFTTNEAHSKNIRKSWNKQGFETKNKAPGGSARESGRSLSGPAVPVARRQSLGGVRRGSIPREKEKDFRLTIQDVTIPLPEINFLSKSALHHREVGDLDFRGYTGEIQVSYVRLLIKEFSFNFSNALLNEVVFYQELFAADIASMSAAIDKVFNKARAKRKAKADAPKSADGPATHTEMQIRLAGANIALHSSIHEGVRKDRPSPAGFALYTKAIEVKFDSQNTPRASPPMVSKFHVGMNPVVYFGQLPFEHTERKLQEDSSVGHLQLQAVVIGKIETDSMNVTTSTVQFSLIDPSLVVPWQALPKVVTFAEDFRFFYAFYRQDSNANLSKEANSTFDSIKNKAKDEARKLKEQAKSQATSDRGSIKFEVTDLLVRMILHTSAHDGTFLVGTLAHTGLTLGDQASRSIGAFEQLRVGFLEPVEADSARGYGFLEENAAQDKRFRLLMKRDNGVNVCLIPKGNLRLFTSKSQYSAEEAKMRGKDTKSVFALIGQIGTDEEKIQIMLDSNIGRLAKVSQGTMNEVSGRLALIDRSRTTGDSGEIVKLQKDLGKYIVILEDLQAHGDKANDTSIDFIIKQIHGKKRALKRCQRLTRKHAIAKLQQSAPSFDSGGSKRASATLSQNYPSGMMRRASSSTGSGNPNSLRRGASIRPAATRNAKAARASAASVAPAESAEVASTEFEFDWSIDVKGGYLTLYIDDDITSRVDKAAGLGHHPLGDWQAPDDGPHEAGTRPRHNDRRYGHFQMQKIPIPQVIVNISYQPPNLKYVSAATSQDYLSGQLRGMLSIKLDDAQFSPATLLFAKVTARKYEITRTLGQAPEPELGEAATEESWDSDALLESLPVSYAFHVAVSSRDSTSGKQSSEITLNCLPKSDTRCSIVLPAFKMYLSAGMNIAKRDAQGRHKEELDVVLKCLTIWLDQIKVSITYPEHVHHGQHVKLGESAKRLNAFHVAVDTITVNATVKTPIGTLQKNRRRDISGLCDIGWAEAEIDSTQSAELKVFKEEWDPKAKKFNFVNRRMYSAGDSEADVHGRNGVGSQLGMIDDHDRIHEEMGDTSDSDGAADRSADGAEDGGPNHDHAAVDDSTSDEDETWSSPEPEHTTILFGLAKLGRLSVRANLGKVLGQLALEVNEAVIRGTKIDRLPDMMTIGLTIKDVAVQDGHAGEKVAKKRESRGIARGSMVASNVTSRISWARPPATLRIGPEEKSKEVCVIHVRTGVGALDAKLRYLSTLILVLRLINTNVKIGSKWHISQLTPDEWLHKCELDANWHSFDCVVTKDTVPLLQRIVDRFRRAIEQQTDDLLGKSEEPEGSTIASTMTSGPVVAVPGVVTISGKFACITLFKNNFNENEWLFIDLNGFKQVFTQFSPGHFPYTRMQTVSFTAGVDSDGKSVAGRNVSDGKSAAGPNQKKVNPFIIAHRRWKRGVAGRPSTEDDAKTWCSSLRSKLSTMSPIFSIPPMSMDTSSFKLGHRFNQKVLSRFATTFNGGFGVTTDANYLVAMNSLIDAYKRKLVAGQAAAPGRVGRAPGRGGTIDAPSSSGGSEDSDDNNEGDGLRRERSSRTVSSSPPQSTITTAVDPDPIKFICLPRVDVDGDVADAPRYFFHAANGNTVDISSEFPAALKRWEEHMALDDGQFDELKMQLLAAEVAASKKFQQGFAKHSDDSCDFTFDPDIHPISVGNIAPPSLDFIMTKLFKIEDPHGTFNENIYLGLNVAMSGILDNMDSVPRPLFAPTKPGAPEMTSAAQVL